MDWASMTTDGVLTAHDGKPTLADLQRAVGGYIERVYVDGVTFDMFAHEEALYAENPVLNPHASYFAQTPIYGDVAFTGTPDRFGNTRKLDKAAQTFLAKFL